MLRIRGLIALDSDSAESLSSQSVLAPRLTGSNRLFAVFYGWISEIFMDVKVKKGWRGNHRKIMKQ